MYSKVIIVTALLAQAMSVPADIKTASTYKPPWIMTYEDLLYIIRYRNGEISNPKISLSPCARAILGCCKKNVMNESCSENLKCGAFFFDDNPCEERFILEALRAAKSFYDQSNSVTS